jgi:hypothetical protein
VTRAAGPVDSSESIGLLFKEHGMKPIEIIDRVLRKLGRDVLSEDIIAALEANGWAFVYNRR